MRKYLISLLILLLLFVNSMIAKNKIVVGGTGACQDLLRALAKAYMSENIDRSTRSFEAGISTTSSISFVIISLVFRVKTYPPFLFLIKREFLPLEFTDKYDEIFE